MESIGRVSTPIHPDARQDFIEQRHRYGDQGYLDQQAGDGGHCQGHEGKDGRQRRHGNRTKSIDPGLNEATKPKLMLLQDALRKALVLDRLVFPNV